MKIQSLTLPALALLLLASCSSLQEAQRNFVNPSAHTLQEITLKPSKLEDPELEQSMITALADAGWKEEVRGLTIIESDWTIVRDPVNANITHRKLPTNVVTHLMGTTDCRLFSLSFKQDYDGANYGKTKLLGVGDSSPVDCEKATSTDNKPAPTE